MLSLWYAPHSNPVSVTDPLMQAQVVDPRRRSLVKHESEPEVLPNDLEVIRAARSVGALSVDQHQAPREALAVGVPQNSHSFSAPVLPPVKAEHRTATNQTGSAADSPGHLTGFSSHLIDSLDEYGGLEYVTPEPAPRQNEVSTVPSECFRFVALYSYISADSYNYKVYLRYLQTVLRLLGKA